MLIMANDKLLSLYRERQRILANHVWDGSVEYNTKRRANQRARLADLDEELDTAELEAERAKE